VIPLRPPHPSDPLDVLRATFGFSGFRKVQREVIGRGHDLAQNSLVLLATGPGFGAALTGLLSLGRVHCEGGRGFRSSPGCRRRRLGPAGDDLALRMGLRRQAEQEGRAMGKPARSGHGLGRKAVVEAD
jgi:hypothetical protein